MSKQRNARFASIVVVMLVAGQAVAERCWAWGGEGHQIVCAMAFDLLSPEDQAKVTKLTTEYVTHGDAPTGQFPKWVPYMASQLKDLKYDATIAFNWAKLAAIPLPGPALVAVDLMAASVQNTIKKVAPNSSWDLHLIGHSRGGVIISLTMDKLISSNVPQLNGYKRMTYLDSHPANASTGTMIQNRAKNMTIPSAVL